MFQVEEQYRVFVRVGDRDVAHEGKCLGFRDGLLLLEVEGVKTIFSVHGGAVTYIEFVDPEAEKARSDRRVSAMIS